MAKRMLVDATHPEETRVAIVSSYRDTNRLEDLDFALASKPVLRGNIYLAKVMRIEPSLQAAFVEYGGNRHGFLPFSEIHPDYFRIPVADRPHEDEEVEPEGITETSAESSSDDFETEEDFEHDIDSETPANEPPSEEEVSNAQETEIQFALPEQPGPLGNDIHEGLITDFGNALVTSAEVPAPPIHVESIGGDMAERVVRRYRPRYKIQEVIKRGQIMLIQVVKEERGNKGAALTTFLSLAGRYCVLMPNTGHGGGVSRKITNHQDRRRMKEILDQLEVPEGMAVILRTAGLEQEPKEIQRDLEYLLRLWDSIREQTLQSTAPALIYEEANLIKKSVRDLFTKDIEEILVAGVDGYNRTREFMAALMPDQVDKIKLYDDPIPLFFRYHVEGQIDKLHSPLVQLRSGGYIVINPTEALVAIDVNSGRATRERHIEETALKTNLEAADEIARQLRLRDLAGLIVIDFIDMEDGRNNAAVERRLKEAMKTDRARLQIGRISPFGLLELSRQRLRPSLLEINFEKCPHCSGTGYIRSVDSAALSILREIEEEGIRQRGSDLVFYVPTKVALYLLNQKRSTLQEIERRYDLHVLLYGDDSMTPPNYKLERLRPSQSIRKSSSPAVNADEVLAETERALQSSQIEEDSDPSSSNIELASESSQEQSEEANKDIVFRKRRFRHSSRRSGRTSRRDYHPAKEQRPFTSQNEETASYLSPESSPSYAQEGNEDNKSSLSEDNFIGDHDSSSQRRRRRGRRGGRRRNNGGENRFVQSENKWNYGTRNTGYAHSPVEDPSTSSFPTSIHEIDTTPRIDESPSAPSSTGMEKTLEQSESQESKPSSSPVSAFSSPYEVVNPPSSKPKGGWWKRLTGGE